MHIFVDVFAQTRAKACMSMLYQSQKLLTPDTENVQYVHIFVHIFVQDLYPLTKTCDCSVSHMEALSRPTFQSTPAKDLDEILTIPTPGVVGERLSCTEM